MHILRDTALASAVLIFLLFSACQGGHSSASSTSQPGETLPSAFTFTYDIDRTAVPNFLYYNDLTLLVQVNDAQTIEAVADGELISYTRDPDSGQIMLTTDAAEVEVQIDGVADPYGVGTLQKGALRNDKGFAWSHGMDDNVFLRKQVEVMERFGWRGTLFLIAETVDDSRDEDWIIDAPYAQQKLADGWSIGSHHWDNGCQKPLEPQKMVDAYNRLSNVIAASKKPNHTLISFAAPCFIEEYHPLVLAQRNAGDTTILFNESSDLTPMIIDANADAAITGENKFDTLAYLFDFDARVGRSTQISLDVQEEIDTIDWMAQRHVQTGEHFWHNTLTHGNEESALETLATHIYNEYGPGGSNEVWVAPSDEIYSYLLVRDRSVVTFTSEPPAPEKVFKIQLPLVSAR